MIDCMKEPTTARAVKSGAVALFLPKSVFIFFFLMDRSILGTNDPCETYCMSETGNSWPKMDTSCSYKSRV